ncbi:MAG TPA: DUF952 domain-containing protein [Kofleriaceae bacterium]
MAIILHITTRAAWEAARAAGSYRDPSLEREGFIHCSTPAQAVGTADRYFRGRDDLVLLCIDESRLTDVRHEPPAVIGGAPDPRAGEWFPHVYGPIALDAVVRVVPFPCDPDGGFTLPAEVAG